MLLHYRIKGVIGAGGMGTVFEAEDMRLGRQVAIKLLHPDDSQDPESRERFLREARALAQIDHPNLCTVHAIEETPTGTLLLVMTLYRGQSLAAGWARSGSSRSRGRRRRGFMRLTWRE